MSNKKPKIEFSESQKENLNKTFQRVENTGKLLSKLSPVLGEIKISLKHSKDAFINMIELEKEKQNKLIEEDEGYLRGLKLPVPRDHKRFVKWILEIGTFEQQLEYDQYGLTEGLFHDFCFYEKKRKDEMNQARGNPITENSQKVGKDGRKHEFTRFMQKHYILLIYYGQASNELKVFADCEGNKIPDQVRNFLKEHKFQFQIKLESDPAIRRFAERISDCRKSIYRLDYLRGSETPVMQLLADYNLPKAILILERDIKRL